MTQNIVLNIEGLLEEISNVGSQREISDLGVILLNALMKKERDLRLKEDLENKGNGFYERQLVSELGKLNISIPRDRKGEFRSSLLPEPWQRYEESHKDLMTKLILCSYSPNQIKNLFSHMNLPYSSEQLEELKEELYKKAKEFRTRELPSESVVIYIDAYHTEIKNEENKVSKAVVYSILGVDMEGHKSIYGYYTFFGSETKEDWLVILNDLIYRGLKRVLLIVSDNFSGLSAAIKSLFPKSDHQLCYVHMQRNVRRNMSKEDAREFNNQLSILRKKKDFDSIVAEFEKLCHEYIKKYMHFIKGLLKNKNLYFAFLKYPESIQKNIYTTNPIENVNSRIEVTRVKAGGYFQSVKTLEISLYVLFSGIQDRKWKKPIPAFRKALYEINQLFAFRFRESLS